MGFALAVLLACGPPSDEGVELALTDAAAWRAPEEGAVDPLASHRPEGATCSEAGWQVEGSALELDTGLCSYVWLTQPLLAAVPEGGLVSGSLWHLDLTAEEPAVAHAAILADGEVVWELEVDVPSAADVHELAFFADRALLPGVEVSIHLHNHGQNTWNLGELTAGATPP